MVDAQGAGHIGCECKGLDSSGTRAIQVYVHQVEKRSRQTEAEG